METQKNDYHISFFKPTTDNTRRNRNIVVQFVLIWAVAVFGFQILLRIIQKPTPEPAYTVYETYWDDVQSDNYTLASLQKVSQSALSVLGKVSIAPKYKLALDNAVSWMAYNIATGMQKEKLVIAVEEFEEVASEIEDISDKFYLEKKNSLISILQNIYALNPNDVRGKIAPLEVKTDLMGSFDVENRQIFEEAMELYLIHNQSFLTDTKFLGFPFHYFYTAVFLLILFVGLCWLFCVRTDMFHKKYGIEE